MCFCLSNRKQGGISKSLEMCIFKCELGLKLGKLAFKNPSSRLRHFLFCSETYFFGPLRDDTRLLKSTESKFKFGVFRDAVSKHNQLLDSEKNVIFLKTQLSFHNCAGI